MKTNPPRDIKFHQKSQRLEVVFDDKTYEMTAEYLRVFSPSAEVRGHGGGPMKLITEKQHIKIQKITPVGHYAIQLTFDDGHDSGLYTWNTLRDLGDNFEANWEHYLNRLATEGGSRTPQTSKAPYKKVE
ncbi:gamma-butyrobetaine hydroxylase-like domain-containing protein [Pleionea sediminis]|uniref:gamma-butyrobetaine hydroxylase-like domain-containing protein n=1 Tax=Pleionea sediminis TaxID=2569479 RepID=UPI0011870A66|nr:DUF971 domain-containing protein [Pleionea sediminis]